MTWRLFHQVDQVDQAFRHHPINSRRLLTGTTTVLACFRYWTMPFHICFQNAFLFWISAMYMCVPSCRGQGSSSLATGSEDVSAFDEYDEDKDINGFSPGHKFSSYSSLSTKMEYEGIVICLLTVTAFIGLIVWVLKSNFEERQQMKMRREASIRDRTSFRGISPSTDQMQQA